MRTVQNLLVNGVTHTGYDYALQVWVRNFLIQRCGHVGNMDCGCNGRRFMGRDVRIVREFKMFKGGER